MQLLCYYERPVLHTCIAHKYKVSKQQYSCLKPGLRGSFNSFVDYFKSVLLNCYQREWRTAAVWAGGARATGLVVNERDSQSFPLIENRNKSAFSLASVRPFLDLEYVVGEVSNIPDKDPQPVLGQKICLHKLIPVWQKTRLWSLASMVSMVPHTCSGKRWLHKCLPQPGG